MSSISSKQQLYGNYPPAKDIRQRDRQVEIEHARKSLIKLWEKERDNAEVQHKGRTHPVPATAHCRYAAASGPSGYNRELTRDAIRKPQRDGVVRLIEGNECKAHIGRQITRGTSLSARQAGGHRDDEFNDIFQAVDKKRLEKRKFEKQLETSGNVTPGRRSSRPRGKYVFTEQNETDPFFIQHTDSLMTTSIAPHSRHFFVSPDWVSEQMIIKRMSLSNRTNPLKYGWI